MLLQCFQTECQPVPK